MLQKSNDRQPIIISGGKRYMKLPPIRPAYALGLNYEIKLHKLTRKMLKDILSTVNQTYKKDESKITRIVGDESPITAMIRVITLKVKDWERLFNEEAPDLATVFINNVDNKTNRVLKSSLGEEKSFKVVGFNTRSRSFLLAKQASIQENVNLIKSIPSKFGEQITQLVTEAMTRGRDTKYLQEHLVKLGNVTENRARTIARDQLNKATNVVSMARQADLGITKNTWEHSKVGKTWRKSHVEANGKVFDVSKGCLIDGEYIYPGEKVNCHCYSAPVIELD